MIRFWAKMIMICHGKNTQLCIGNRINISSKKESPANHCSSPACSIVPATCMLDRTEDHQENAAAEEAHEQPDETAEHGAGRAVAH